MRPICLRLFFDTRAFLRSRQFGRWPNASCQGRPKGRAPSGACARACDDGPQRAVRMGDKDSSPSVQNDSVGAARQNDKAISAKVADFCAREIAPTKNQFQQKLQTFALVKLRQQKTNSSESCTTFALVKLRQQKTNSSESCTTLRVENCDNKKPISAKVARLCVSKIAPTKNQFQDKLLVSLHSRQLALRLHGGGPDRESFALAPAGLSPGGSARAAERPGVQSDACHRTRCCKRHRLARVKYKARIKTMRLEMISQYVCAQQNDFLVIP